MKRLLYICVATLVIFTSCSKIKELRDDPDLTPLQQGFKATSAINYCASLAVMAFQGETLPPQVRVSSGSGNEYSQSIIMYVEAGDDFPVPFNSHIGEVIIAGIWDANQESGVISIIFGDLDIFNGELQFYGMHTVPVKRKFDSERFITVFAQQDVVIGQGSDTLLNLGLIPRIEFDKELERLEDEQPDDVFIAVSQNVWFTQFYQNDPADLYDDSYEVNGGGQIAEAANTSGGITYHALIETKYDGSCTLNPNRGTGFIQNIKAGEGVDLGNITLDFHSECDGKADVTFATGKYVSSNGRAVNIHFD